MALKPGQNSVIITYKNENTHEYIYFKIVKNFLMKINFTSIWKLQRLIFKELMNYPQQLEIQ